MTQNQQLHLRTEYHVNKSSPLFISVNRIAKIEMPRKTGKHLFQVAVCWVVMLACGRIGNANDWPMWRHDAGRTGAVASVLPQSLELQWVRHLPEITPAFHSPRLQFDAGHEPIVAAGQLLVASSRTDSVTAYEASTGRELWVYHTNGPVRLAPAVWKESVCFGSDDGNLYCVDLKTGRLRWKHRAVPSQRRLLGNRRLISVWPVRGGPVVADGRVYFAAGVWPFEGVFVYAIDIASGNVVWRNDRLGYLFGQQPHNTQAIGGLAPQGYLVVNGDELIVPCSTAYPARLNRETGELIEFELPTAGRFPGGWFAAIDKDSARAARRGKLMFDDVVNRQKHEGELEKGHGVSGVSRTIQIGERVLNFDDGFEGVEGTVHSMAAADERLFVSTREGRIYCFAEANPATATKVKHWREPMAKLATSAESSERARKLLAQSAGPHGYAIVVGLKDGALVKALLMETQYHVVALDDDRERVDRLRRELVRAGVHGRRSAVVECDPREVALPPYLATVITTEDPDSIATGWDDLLPALRPFGGLAALRMPSGPGIANAASLQALETGKFELLTSEGQALVRRTGPLPGAAEYAGDYALTPDTLVRFPLGVLWFDDTLAHFKRTPQPQFTGGIMISRPKDWHAKRIKGNYSVDYPLLPPVLSDIYTGRVLAPKEQPELRAKLPDSDRSKPQQSYYHAPHQKTALGPPPPIVGERRNPLTGETEPRAFPKMYGCDGGVDYGLLYTLRSGTAAFYDKSLESGTVFLSGPRSGCTNSIIPSGGVLNVPYFYEGCTCSYPLPTAMSLVAMPEAHEQWSSWGAGQPKPNTIERIGLNFGAPGDRMTRDGTLWLDYPAVGGPSPKITVSTTPEELKFHYRHSVWMKGGEGWPWVAASAVEGLSQLTLNDLKPGRYTVRLFFAELDERQLGDRVQTVSVQGREVARDFDIVARAEGVMKGIVQQISDVEVDGDLTLKLTASSGQSLISGIEIIQTP